MNPRDAYVALRKALPPKSVAVNPHVEASEIEQAFSVLFELTAGYLEGDDTTDRPRETCGCGYELVWVDGEWQHDAAPYLWGDDHDANAPEPPLTDPERRYWDDEDYVDYEYGRCDECGAPCDKDGCVDDRTHEAAMDVPDEDELAFARETLGADATTQQVEDL